MEETHGERERERERERKRTACIRERRTREGGVFRELSRKREGIEFVQRNECLAQDLGHMSSDPYC